jgi:HEAT repeat protein
MQIALPILVVLVLGVFMVLASLLVRTWGLARERRVQAVVQRLRPDAIELVDTDEAPAPILDGLEARVFADLLVHYSQQLRGESDARISAYFEAAGVVDGKLRQLRSRREKARVEAAFGLGDLATVRVVPDLMRALDDRSWDVRAAAVRSLGRLGAVDSVEALVARSANGQVSSAVVGLALLEVGPSALPHLVDLLDHPDSHVRAGAIRLVGLLGSAGEAAALPARLRDPSAEVRAAAAGALGRLGVEDGRDVLIALLDDRVPFVRAAAAHALGQIGGDSAAQALLQVARSDEFDPASAAAKALAGIDPQLVLSAAAAPDAGPHLREAADRLTL